MPVRKVSRQVNGADNESHTRSAQAAEGDTFGAPTATPRIMDSTSTMTGSS